MRIAFYLLATSAMASSGCSMLIVDSGISFCNLRTSASVHEEFGSPIEVGRIEDGSFEDFSTRRKINEVNKNDIIDVGNEVTRFCWRNFGSGLEFFVSLKRFIVGQTIHVEYDQFGNVIKIGFKDGSHVYGLP